jgi:hypothetical protein
MYRSHLFKNVLSLFRFPLKGAGALIFIWSDLDSEERGSRDPDADPDILSSTFHFSFSKKDGPGAYELANSDALKNVVVGSGFGSVTSDKAAITSADFSSSRCCSMVGMVIEITPGAYSSSSSFSSSENGFSSSCSESDSPECWVLSR